MPGLLLKQGDFAATRERILEGFGGSRASIHFADELFLSTQMMLSDSARRLLDQHLPALDLFHECQHTAILQAAGAVCYQVTPGTWVTASRYPACCATNGSNRSSACRIVPSLGNGSSG